MSQITIDDVGALVSPQAMVQAIDDNFDELYDNTGIDPANYNAVGDGVTDDTTAIQNALDAADAVGLPVLLKSIYKLTNKISVPDGASLFGTSRDNTGFTISKLDFNLSATAILDLNAGTKNGPCLDNFKIITDIDTTETTRGNLTAFPPAIRAYACPRCFLSRLRIEKFITGIDITGNSGGSHLTDLEIGTYEYGIKIDGALDFMFLDNVEFWPFGIAGTDSEAIYKDSTNIGMDCKNCDGVAFGTITSFWCEHIFADSFGIIQSLLCDGKYSRLKIAEGCNLGIGSFYSTTDANDDFAIAVVGTSASRLIVANAWLSNNIDITAHAGLLSCSYADSELIIGNLNATITGATTRLLYVTAGLAMFNNAYIDAPVDITRANDLIYCSNGLVNLSNVRVPELTTGSGVLLTCTTDDDHNLNNITAPGWTIALASPYLYPQLSNILSGTETLGERIIGNRKLFTFTGTLDASGNKSFSTNFPDHDKIRCLTAMADTGTSWFAIPPQFLHINTGVVSCLSGDTNYSGYVVTIQVEMALT